MLTDVNYRQCKDVAGIFSEYGLIEQVRIISFAPTYDWILINTGSVWLLKSAGFNTWLLLRLGGVRATSFARLHWVVDNVFISEWVNDTANHLHCHKLVQNWQQMSDVPPLSNEVSINTRAVLECCVECTWFHHTASNIQANSYLNDIIDGFGIKDAQRFLMF